MKSKKKKPDICEFYLKNFICKIPPKEFLKILHGEHEVLEMINNYGMIVLRIKNTANKNSKSYDFYATKDGTQIRCINNYYQINEEGELKSPLKNCSCIETKRFFGLDDTLLYCPKCDDCHRRMFNKWENNSVELKPNKKG